MGFAGYWCPSYVSYTFSYFYVHADPCLSCLREKWTGIPEITLARGGGNCKFLEQNLNRDFIPIV